MLKKLRIKFTLINMTIVTIMLGLIFGMLYFSTSRNLERESLQMMRTIAMKPMHMAPPDIKQKEMHLPYFSVMINRMDGKIEISGGFYDLSDQELLQEILKQVFERNTESGILTDYNLRFLQVETPRGQCFVFADITSERSMLHNLVITFALIGGAAFFVFLGISVLLAKRVVKPIEKAWQQQKQFVADASHELKTPLTVIMTNAELLHTPECSDAERKQMSGNIIAMAGQMRCLVEGLLELARLDNGSVKETLEITSFSELLSDAAMMFEPVFFEKEMPFSYEIEPEIIIKGNSMHLKQLADILLDNAAKYALPGGETILTLKQSSSKKCILKVSNQGEKIPDKEIKNLFKRFYRVDKARTRNESYGLGLSIAESIAKEHHGRIWAEGQDGYNSFYVELPKGEKE